MKKKWFCRRCENYQDENKNYKCDCCGFYDLILRDITKEWKLFRGKIIVVITINILRRYIILDSDGENHYLDSHKSEELFQINDIIDFTINQDWFNGRQLDFIKNVKLLWRDEHREEKMKTKFKCNLCMKVFSDKPHNLDRFKVKDCKDENGNFLIDTYWQTCEECKKT